MMIFLSNLHWFSTSTSEKNTKFLNLNIEKELEAHLFRIRSTHEYYNLTWYKLLTHTHLHGRAHFWFWWSPHLLNNSIEKQNQLKIHGNFPNFTHLFWTGKYENFQLHPKHFFLNNILSMKYSDLNFYWNRRSRTCFARAIWSS